MLILFIDDNGDDDDSTNIEEVNFLMWSQMLLEIMLMKIRLRA